MAAMESSTKNAKEMLGKLTLSYNRRDHFANDIVRRFLRRGVCPAFCMLARSIAVLLQSCGLALHRECLLWLVADTRDLNVRRSRQAAITTELTEIISGAAALEK